MSWPPDYYVEALAVSLWREGINPPFLASTADFTDEQIAAGAFRKANNDANRRNLAAVRRALMAAGDPESRGVASVDEIIITAPDEGEIVYARNEDRYYRYDGSTWVQCEPCHLHGVRCSGEECPEPGALFEHHARKNRPGNDA